MTHGAATHTREEVLHELASLFLQALANNENVVQRKNRKGEVQDFEMPATLNQEEWSALSKIVAHNPWLIMVMSGDEPVAEVPQAAKHRYEEVQAALKHYRDLMTAYEKDFPDVKKNQKLQSAAEGLAKLSLDALTKRKVPSSSRFAIRPFVDEAEYNALFGEEVPPETEEAVS